MKELDRYRRKLILREAEGYCELATAGEGPIALSPSTRDLMATRCLETLERLDDESVDRAEAWLLKGVCLRLMERHADAILALEKAAALDHDNIHIWLALGWCYKRTNRLDKAIESLEEGLAVDPRQAILHYNLACYWSLAHDVKHAVKYLEKAFDLDPNYRDLVAEESDFNSIRHEPRFQDLMTVIV